MAKPIALVTGASIGIGAATAVALGKEGYRVIVTDVLEKEGKAGMPSSTTWMLLTRLA